MIRPIDIRLNAAHPELPLAEAVTFTGSPSTVLIRGVPPNCGRWAITAVSVAATFPDGSTTTRAAVQSANGVWVATLPATARSGRTENGLRVMADGIDENGAAVTGYILGVADFAVASLGVTPAPEPGETSWQMLYFDAVPSTLRKGDVAKVDGVLKLYNGTAWEAFAGDIPAPSTSTPAMDGTGAAGTSAAFARGDHVHPTDTSRMAASATGADIPLNPSVGAPNLNSVVNTLSKWIGEHVNDTTIHVTAAEKSTWNGKQDALTQTQLDNIAAVPDKASKADATLTERRFSTWNYDYSDGRTSWGPLVLVWSTRANAWYPTIQRIIGAMKVATGNVVTWAAGEWMGGVELVATRTESGWTCSPDEYGQSPVGIMGDVGEQVSPYIEVQGSTTLGNASSTSLDVDIVQNFGPDAGSGVIHATRTALQGYKLGSQTDKPLASEAEAEALRQGKADRAANPTAGNLAALDASGNPTDAGYHFEVRNGIPCIVQYA